jgi:hypothetical protein
LDEKEGSLVIFSYNEIRDEVVNMACKALTPCAVCDEPLIKPAVMPKRVWRLPPPLAPVRRKWNRLLLANMNAEDLFICGFWVRGTSCALGVHIADANTKSFSKCWSPRAAKEREEMKVFGGVPQKTLSL